MPEDTELDGVDNKFAICDRTRTSSCHLNDHMSSEDLCLGSRYDNDGLRVVDNDGRARHYCTWLEILEAEDLGRLTPAELEIDIFLYI